MKCFRLAVALTLAALCQAPLAARAPATTPQQAVETLLAADRAFATASAGTDIVTGLSAMFDEDVVMPLPSFSFARGRTEAVAALRANPANLTGRAEWAPVRAGLAADGQHGFTLGYMTIRQQDGTSRPAKYLSYWVRRPQGWRVALYRRSGRPEGAVPTEMMAPALPPRLVAPRRNPHLIQRHAAGLALAERSFSNDAQRIGVGPAFRFWGTADSTNMGREAAFQVGAEAIGADGGGPPAEISWGPDGGVLVASSGDLGVTWGYIRPNGPPPVGQPAQVPFFTVWRRAAPGAPWRYVAE